MTYRSIVAVYQTLSRAIVLRMVCIFLTALILWELVSGIATLFTLNKPIPFQEIPSLKATQEKVSNVGLTTPFFGEYVPNGSDVKESRLNLKVVGILFSSQEGSSFVILHAEGAGDQLFNVGDFVPGGAIIRRITADGVLVERNGALESLSFPKNELIFQAQPKPLVED